MIRFKKNKKYLVKTNQLGNIKERELIYSGQENYLQMFSSVEGLVGFYEEEILDAKEIK